MASVSVLAGAGDCRALFIAKYLKPLEAFRKGPFHSDLAGRDIIRDENCPGD